MQFLSRLIFCLFLLCVSQAHPKEKRFSLFNLFHKNEDKPKPAATPSQVKKPGIFYDLVPDELLNFFLNLPWEQQEYIDRVKIVIAEAYKKGTPLSSDRINDRIKDLDPELFDKKMELVHLMNKKIDALTPKGRDYIEKLCVTSVMTERPGWGLGSDEKNIAYLKKETPGLSESDRNAIVEQFPKYKLIFQRFGKH
ncbi:hypothetical protein L596_015745 [Steinernema carpocapsae]|uniref:Fatty-acid and retinol-binding protein 1 n=1 Tax=Steinernema carpocapsae TaxID=34508 RepID=A0A4U5NGJ6_STECR|nr:hypothetical protein L596_015745 [Steinernema carpocapsae]